METDRTTNATSESPSVACPAIQNDKRSFAFLRLRFVIHLWMKSTRPWARMSWWLTSHARNRKIQYPAFHLEATIRYQLKTSMLCSAIPFLLYENIHYFLSNDFAWPTKTIMRWTERCMIGGYFEVLWVKVLRTRLKGPIHISWRNESRKNHDRNLGKSKHCFCNHQ